MPLLVEVAAGVRLSAGQLCFRRGIFNDAKRPLFDCLIVGIQLGGISGIELSEMLANSRLVTPVIFLTALDDLDDLEQILPKRYAGLLHKNDPGGLVLAAIDKAISSNNNCKVRT